jgi:thiamine monophosphate kinase
LWRTDEEQWDAMAIVRVVFQKSDLPAKAAEAQAIMDAIAADTNATVNPVEPGE